MTGYYIQRLVFMLVGGAFGAWVLALFGSPPSFYSLEDRVALKLVFIGVGVVVGLLLSAGPPKKKE